MRILSLELVVVVDMSFFFITFSLAETSFPTDIAATEPLKFFINFLLEFSMTDCFTMMNFFDVTF